MAEWPGVHWAVPTAVDLQLGLGAWARVVRAGFLKETWGSGGRESGVKQPQAVSERGGSN